MSIFPTTRIGRALVVSAVVVGVAKIVPFLLQVFSLTGDELTELPPLTPAGTDTTFLLANPVAWFLAVAAAVYLVLALRDVVVHLVSPPPPPRARARARARTTAARSGTKRTTATTSTRRPPSGRTATTRAAKPQPKPRAAAATRSAARPAPRTTTKRGSTTTGRTGTARRPASRR
ncbi:hypothetical protein ASF37_07595 [Aeromicrobium sp. Leaf289]|uniref:hypothetical protein n=1 Tax=Aeromicrobium sp. Leaf289 TaxID=1736324 RepID=UPI0006FDCD3B|nr:hypothetical protein [Aeromicrobium sp. Leaf289]KQP78418.1 hypothetical protein ASF37_07595 [Aeromicrobium sp. Leaf289]